ncbi:MAG: DNA polymerase, partial [Patescibacteria group bacterium]|nr:DNA polymerase [Patescibacteria group bacterium]
EQVKKKKDLEVVIASGDKDALQLIEGSRVTVFTLGKGLNDTVSYDEERVKERYGFGPGAVADLKGIAGDPSDNIKGVPGVGEGSALKLLQKYASIKGVFAALKKEGVEGVAAATGVQKRFVQLVADNKKEAEFSKLLATIRRDAPIAFELPQQTWREGANPRAALDMLAEFEFRGLVPRVKNILGVAEAAAPEPAAGEGLFKNNVAPEAFYKAQVAVSVLDSAIAEPSMDDVLRMGKSENFDEALGNLQKQIKEQELQFVYERIELPLGPVLRRMEKRGVTVDKEFLKKLSGEYTKELGRISKRIYAHAGGEFNVSSPKQLGEVLFDKLGLETKKKTAGGARSTRESELQKLAGVHPIIEDILAYRELSKLLGTYIDAL